MRGIKWWHGGAYVAVSAGTLSLSILQFSRMQLQGAKMECLQLLFSLVLLSAVEARIPPAEQQFQGSGKYVSLFLRRLVS